MNNSTSSGNPISLLYKKPPFYSFIVTLTSCGLSLLGSLLIIITYLIWKDLQTTSRKLLLYLSLAELLSGIGIGYGTLRTFLTTQGMTGVECEIQSVVSTFATLSSLFWGVALTAYLYTTVVTVDSLSAAKALTHSLIICFGFPVVIVFLAVLFRGLGPTYSLTTVGWCWVDMTRTDAWLWMLLTGKVWEIAAYAIQIVLCILIRREIKKKCQEPCEAVMKGTIASMKIIDKKLFFIPLLFILLRIWGTIRFFLAVQGSAAVYNNVLTILQGIGDPAHGTVSFVLYFVCTLKTREKFRTELQGLCRFRIFTCWCPQRVRSKPQTAATFRYTLKGNLDERKSLLEEKNRTYSATDNVFAEYKPSRSISL